MRKGRLVHLCVCLPALLLTVRCTRNHIVQRPSILLQEYVPFPPQAADPGIAQRTTSVKLRLKITQ